MVVYLLHSLLLSLLDFFPSCLASPSLGYFPSKSRPQRSLDFPGFLVWQRFQLLGFESLLVVYLEILGFSLVILSVGRCSSVFGNCKTHPFHQVVELALSS
jgi:hypothetical protein